MNRGGTRQREVAETSAVKRTEGAVIGRREVAPNGFPAVAPVVVAILGRRPGLARGGVRRFEPIGVLG